MKIKNLSVNEQKLRDLYLRKLALGEIQGPPTGYASIDKPWLKYYSKEVIQKDFEPMSIYQLMESKSIGHEEEIALEYFGRKITYGELLQNIDITAKALLELGVKKGDYVMMSLPNIPEAEYLLYAVNKIGGIVNSMDPRESYEEILMDAKDTNVQFFFGIDMIYPKIKDLQNYGIQVINVSPNYSLPLPIKMVANIKSPKYEGMNWDKFIKLGKKSSIEKVETVFEENQLAVIVHTGGTTGTPKGVQLSNENLNGLIYQMMYGYDNFYRGQSFLNILPPFVAIGLNNAMHLSACLGLKSIMIPTFEPEDIPNLVLKYKPNVFLCGPIHFNMLMKDPKVKDKDLSFLEVVCSGGDKVSKKSQEEFQTFLKEHHAPANAWIGYGASETSAGISCMKDKCFTLESVGVPYLKNIISIVDLDTEKEVQGYYQEGEITVKAPTIMMGYCGNHADETNDVVKTDEEGEKVYHTGDIGYVDKDGRIFITGRIRRTILRRAFKMYPQFIEKIIMEHFAVSECAVVGVPDEEELNIPVASIVIKPEYANDPMIKKDIIRYVDEAIEKNLPAFAELAGYNFLPTLPVTKIGKLDFKALESMGIVEGKKRVLKNHKMM